MPIPTHHSIKQLRRRAGMKKEQVPDIAQAAFSQGVSFHDATGRLKQYLSKLYHSHGGTASQIRTYNGFVYIFNKGILFTSYPIPGHLNKLAKQLQKKKAEGGSNE